jgi:HAMP domain-containing protein
MALRWRTKLFLLLVAFSVLPLSVLIYYGAEVQQRIAREATLDGLDALARAKAEAIDQFTAFRKRDVERIAYLTAPRVQRLREAKAKARVEKPPDDPLPLPDKTAPATGTPSDPQPPSPPLPLRYDGLPPEPNPQDARRGGVQRSAQAEHEEASTALSRALSLILWDQGEFEELLVLDPSGIVIASTFSGHRGNTAEKIGYFENGRRGTYLQPMFLSPITNQLSMVVATPIRTAEAEELGVLAARLSLTRFFRLIGDTTGLGRTGETVVGKMTGDNVLFMAPTRHDPKAAFERNVPLEGKALDPLVEAARGQSSRGVMRDYRGKATFAAWHYVPALDWGLVVKMDEEEALRSALAAERSVLLIALLVALAAALASVVFARALVRPLGDLKDATDRISRGDFAVQLNIRSKDEIGELADSFERMVAAIKFFRERAARATDDETDEPDAIAAREEQARLRVEGGVG